VSDASLTYVYGLTRATAQLPDEPGIGDCPLRMLRLGSVAAVVSDVPAAEFAEDALEHVGEAGRLGAVGHRRRRPVRGRGHRPSSGRPRR